MELSLVLNPTRLLSTVSIYQPALYSYGTLFGSELEDMCTPTRPYREQEQGSFQTTKKKDIIKLDFVQLYS